MAKTKPHASAQSFASLYAHGFVRVAACAPIVSPVDPAANAAAILAFARAAEGEGAALLLTPELSLTGYAIDDLLHQQALLDAVETALQSLKLASVNLLPALIVGAPLRLGGSLYNCAVVLHRGQVLGVVPKSFLPDYREYYEKRHFASAVDAPDCSVVLCGEAAPFGADLVFAAEDLRDAAFFIEICEDFWAPSPPSTLGALAGAAIFSPIS